MPPDPTLDPASTVAAFAGDLPQWRLKGRGAIAVNVMKAVAAHAFLTGACPAL